jgi:hypothetical protein
MTLRRTASLLTSLFVAASAGAAENWQALGFTTTAKNVPKLMAATEKFMASEAGKSLPGSLSIMANVIDGASPATHTFITSMESLAAREQWTASLEGNADWIALRDTVTELGERGASSRMIFLKSWGGTGDGDPVWHLFGLVVEDDAAYVKALDQLMASEIGKQFPGSLYLSSVAAAGMSPVTHIVSVGHASEAESEAWNAKLLSSADWAAFQLATRGISDVAGSWVLRTLKTWNAAPAMP